MSTPRNQLIDFIEQGDVPAEKINAALSVLQVRPRGERWRSFIDHLLLWLGGLALAFAVMFFIAYNWEDLGRFAKFGMVEGFLVLAVAVYCKFDDNSMAGKVSLLTSTIALGVLLALYGQTYQTGADPWQLFFNWALLMVPWAFIGRFPAIWIVWVALINISICLYYPTFRGIFGFVFSSETAMFWVIFLVNTLALVVWQFLATTRQYLSASWAIRLLAVGSGVPLTWLVLFSIFDYPDAGFIPWLIWPLWLAAMHHVYRKIAPDLFMLAGCCLSIITVTLSFLSKHMFRHMDDSIVFLFLAVIVIAMGGGSAMWLKKVHREFSS